MTDKQAREFESRLKAAFKADARLQELDAEIASLHKQLDAKEQQAAEHEDAIIAAVKKEMGITQVTTIEQGREQPLRAMSIA